MTTITSWGAAIISSFANALASVFNFIPRLVSFLVILLIGWIVASALDRAVTWLLRRVGFDRISERTGLTRLEQRMNIRMDSARLLGKIVYWFVFLIFLIPAIDSLGLPTISALLSTLITYIPNIFVAVVILFLGTLLATFVADLVRSFMSRRYGNPNLIANIARGAIIGFAALIALEQLQIAPALLNILFTAIVGALALAFGLAFGLGGRETAQRWLARGESNLTGAMPSSGTSTPTEAGATHGAIGGGRGREYSAPYGDQPGQQQVFAQKPYTEQPKPPYRPQQ